VLTAWLAAVLPLCACIGVSPEDQRRASLGDAPDGDEEHRPGQPCLACHSEDYDPGGRVFVLAGTVYRRTGDPESMGLEGAELRFLDAEGHEFGALTNRVGNFMINVDTSLSEPLHRTKGRLTIPYEPVFPLSVSYVYLGEEKAMESLIWREGSCATCHYGSEADVDHVEKVWFEEETP
jgi:hypothetical protein